MRSVPRPLLSARQAEIAQLLATGKSNREIAAALSLSERTVESHVAALFNKLNVGSRTEVAATVLRPSSAVTESSDATNLPFATDALIGRESDVAQICALLAENRLVTLSGAGGVGKTRTALAVGGALLERTPAGVWLAELAPVGDASFVTAVVAQAVNVEELPNRPLLQTLVAHVQGKSLLLILDNCEHVIAEIALLVSALLRGSPRMRILATSRERLRIPGEQAYRLPSLRAPTAAQTLGLRESTAAEFASVQLFVRRARAVNDRFVFSDENASDVGEICRRLDGIPLAIELAAARMTILSAGALCAKLDRRFAILTGGDRTALPRHRTMRALIDWSYDLLAPAERRLFARLAVFCAGCTLEMATAVCADDDRDELEILPLLGSLVDKSLISVDTHGLEPRYRLLESTRQYAAERLAECGEAAAVAQRHAAAYLHLVERLQSVFELAPDVTWYARTKAELENWRAALTWALSHDGDILLGQRLAGALAPTFKNFALAEGCRWLNAALERVDERTPATVVALLEYAAADAADVSAQHDAAVIGSRRALALYRAIGDARGIARAQTLLGRTLDVVRRPAHEIEPLFQGALDAARTLGDRQLVGLTLRSLGLFSSRLGMHSQARVYLTDALQMFELLGADFDAARVTHCLAMVEFDAGNVEEALRLGTLSLASTYELGFAAYITKSHNMLAEYLIVLERWADACAHARKALDLARETQQADVIVWGLHHLAAVAALSSREFTACAQHEIAAVLLGYVDANLPTIGRSRHQDEQREYDRTLDALQVALDAAELASLMARGAALTTDAALERSRSISCSESILQ